MKKKASFNCVWCGEHSITNKKAQKMVSDGIEKMIRQGVIKAKQKQRDTEPYSSSGYNFSDALRFSSELIVNHIRKEGDK